MHLKVVLGTIDSDDNPDISDLVKAVAEILELDIAAAADIVEASLHERGPPEGLDILGTVEAQDGMGKDACGATLTFLEAEELRKLEHDKFMTEIKKCRESSAPPKTSTAGRPAVNMPPSTEDWTVTSAQALCPPFTRIYRDHLNCRWRVWYGKKTALVDNWSISKSWGLSGEDDGPVRHCLLQVWRRHTALTGEECWVQDLF